MNRFFSTLALSLTLSSPALADSFLLTIDDAEGTVANLLIEGVSFAEADSGEEALTLALNSTGETEVTVFVTSWAEGLQLECEGCIVLDPEEMRAMLEQGVGLGGSYTPAEGVLSAEGTIAVQIDHNHHSGGELFVQIDHNHRDGGELIGRYGNAWRAGNWGLVGQWGRYGNAW